MTGLEGGFAAASGAFCLLNATHLYRGRLLVAEYLPGYFVGDGGGVILGWRDGYDTLTPVASGQTVRASAQTLEYAARFEYWDYRPYVWADRWELGKPAAAVNVDWDAVPLEERPVPAEVLTVHT